MEDPNDRKNHGTHDHKYSVDEIQEKLDAISHTNPSICMRDTICRVLDGNPTREDLDLAAVSIWMIGVQIINGPTEAAKIAHRLSNGDKNPDPLFMHKGNNTVN